MNPIQIACLLVFLIIVISIVCWKILFKPLFEIQKLLSISILEKIAPHIHSSHNTLTTLSASAIVLTFSVLEAFSSKPITNSNMIIVTWLFFLLSVLLGVSITIITYIYKAVSEVLVQVLVKAEKDNKSHEKLSESEKKFISDGLPKMLQLRRIMFLLLYGQVISFVSATIFLIGFAWVSVTGG